MSEKKGLFGGLFGKKKSGCCDIQIVEDTGDSADTGCGCEGGCCPAGGESKEEIDPDLPTIKILGTGCKNCSALEQNVRLALNQTGPRFNLIKVTDLGEIASYGVMSVPGLVVENEVISYGKVLKPLEIINILQNI